MMKPTCSIDLFTPEAAQQWEKIPQCVQERILANVWCGRCLGSVAIVLEVAEMVGEDLVFRGKCRNCAGNVCRVVELE